MRFLTSTSLRPRSYLPSCARPEASAWTRPSSSSGSARCWRRRPLPCALARPDTSMRPEVAPARRARRSTSQRPRGHARRGRSARTPSDAAARAGTGRAPWPRRCGSRPAAGLASCWLQCTMSRQAAAGGTRQPRARPRGESGAAGRTGPCPGLRLCRRQAPRRWRRALRRWLALSRPCLLLKKTRGPAAARLTGGPRGRWQHASYRAGFGAARSVRARSPRLGTGTCARGWLPSKTQRR